MPATRPAGEASTAQDDLRAPADDWLSSIPGLAGRTFLVLGGGYLLRFANEAGWLSPALGLGLGVVYALAWLAAADRAAARGLRASAVAHAVASSLIVFPMT